LRLPNASRLAQTMRERGLNPVACLEIETLAASVLVATSLQDASGHRAQKLEQSCNILSANREKADGSTNAAGRTKRSACRAQGNDRRGTDCALHMTNEACRP
jgi:hypothetical protein